MSLTRKQKQVNQENNVNSEILYAPACKKGTSNYKSSNLTCTLYKLQEINALEHKINPCIGQMLLVSKADLQTKMNRCSR